MAFATPAFAQSSTTVTTTAKQYFAQHHRPPWEDATEANTTAKGDQRDQLLAIAETLEGAAA